MVSIKSMCCNLPTHNFYYFAGKNFSQEGLQVSMHNTHQLCSLGLHEEFLSLKFSCAHSWVQLDFPMLPVSFFFVVSCLF